MDLNDKIYRLVKRSFPDDERFVLSSQIRRASDSIVLNIAEGCTGQSNATFKNFISYAIRSAIEVVSCLFIARKREYISEDIFRVLYSDIEILSKKLAALKNTL